MPTLLQTVFRVLSSAEADGSEDSALLQRFAESQDHAAFAALVRRHGGLVWGVCRQMLPSEADAEDAFQAVFLVLVKRPWNALRARALGGWLHGVAVKVCLKSRRTAARLRKREERGAKAEVVLAGEPDWNDLQAAVHEEVEKLPTAHRAAFVLCDLQGVRQPDAAARLGWKLGTLTGRLARARKHLMARLTARGLAPAVALATAGVVAPPVLADKALSLAAGGAIPAAVWTLTRSVLEGVTMKMKLLAATVLTAAAVSVGWLATAGAQPGPGSGPPVGNPGGAAPLAPAAGAPPRPGFGSNSGSDPLVVGPGTIAAAQPRVEHELIDVPDSEKALVDLFRKRQSDGWEFAGQVQGGKYQKLAFKRPAKKDAGGISTMPPGMGMPGMPGPGIPSPGAPGVSLPAAPSAAGGSAPRVLPAGGGDGGAPAKAAEADIVVIRLKNAAAADVATAITQLFRGSDVGVVAEPTSNTLLIRAAGKTLDSIQLVIEKIDSAERDPSIPGPRRPAK